MPGAAAGGEPMCNQFLTIESTCGGQTKLPSPNFYLSIEILKRSCQTGSIPVIIPAAQYTGGKAGFLVMSFLIFFTSSKHIDKALR